MNKLITALEKLGIEVTITKRRIPDAKREYFETLLTFYTYHTRLVAQGVHFNKRDSLFKAVCKLPKFIRKQL